MISIAGLFPELLGTYGDGGNADVLSQRLRWRGLEVETVTVAAGEPVPDSCDLYVLGGGEDGPQTLAAEELAASGALGRAVDRGAAVLAVCAGFQILGTSFVGPDGGAHAGLGLLDCTTRRGAGRRRVGEIVVKPEAFPLPQLTGYENHQGVTRLGSGSRPLGRVVSGSGNDGGDRSEGAVSGKVVGTYLHGPVLARNPAVADLLLSWIVGTLAPLDDTEVEELRDERLGAARRRFWQFGRDPARRAIAVF
jgi:CobQ-like glutamine amidotransferase family enzyme